MENIYNSWNRFHEQQKNFSPQFLKQLMDHSSTWQKKAYPTGEQWRYVKFNQLPTSPLKLAEAGAPVDFRETDRAYEITVSDFSKLETVEIPGLPDGVSIQGMAAALEAEDNSQFVLNRFKNTGHNLFADSALSFVGLGLSMKVDEQVEVEKPVVIRLDLNSAVGKDLHAVYQLDIQLAEGAKATFMLDVKASELSGLSQIRVDADLKPEAVLNFNALEAGGPESYCFYNFNGQVSHAAKINHMDFTLPSMWSRHDVNINLNDENAETDIRGAYFDDENNFTDHHTSINHNIKNTFSNEDYRGILTGAAQAVFNGRVYIAEGARGSNSEQINRNLMLSRKAEVDTKPELQIYNDDVKAAHGATVGQLDEEQRFYLQSRGFSSSQAAKVLAKAFVFDLLEDGSEETKSFYSDRVSKVLDSFSEEG